MTDGIVACDSKMEHETVFQRRYSDTPLSRDSTVCCIDIEEGFVSSSVATALYDAFDRLCEQYGLTRVKTLADSYVVVSGLSERETTDHTVSMVHFVLDCQSTVNQLCANLLPDLGCSGKRLPFMRYSIHSGPESLTRLLKVASFMARTGAGGKCHMSKTTMKQLKRLGKGHWVQRRNDGALVGATYWLVTEQKEC